MGFGFQENSNLFMLSLTMFLVHTHTLQHYIKSHQVFLKLSFLQ